MHIKKFKIEYLALVLSIVLTFALSVRTDTLDYNHPHFKFNWDHHKYIWMALNNLDFHIAPFCWRIFVPFLASILPFELSLNFKLISISSIVLTGFFTFKIGQKIFSDLSSSFALMFAYFSIGFVTKYVIHNFWLPDSFTFLLITLGLYSILIKNDLLFLAVMTIGAMTKESVLFVLPLYYTFNATKLFDFQVFKKTLFISIIPIIVFITIRIIIPPFNEDPEYLSSLSPQLRNVNFDDSTYNLKYLYYTIGLPRLKEFSFTLLYNITIYSFLIHFILALIDWKTIKIFGPKFLPLVVLSYLQILFAVNTERLVVVAFLPFIILSIYNQKKIFDRITNSTFVLPLINLLIMGLVISSGIFYGNWVILRQIFLFVTFILFLSIIKKFKDRKQNTGLIN
ncbi:MAG: hypothetical protein ACPL25_06465 [Ignavibacteria bacterium]